MAKSKVKVMHSIVSTTVSGQAFSFSVYILDISNKSTQLTPETVLQHITANNLYIVPVLTTLWLTL